MQLGPSCNFKGAFNRLQKKRGWLKVIQRAKEDWYNSTLKHLEMRCAVEAMGRGEVILKKTWGIWRKLSLRIARHLLGKNTPDAYEERLDVAILQSALGRSGEVSTACWKMYVGTKTMKSL